MHFLKFITLIALFAIGLNYLNASQIGNAQAPYFYTENSYEPSVKLQKGNITKIKEPVKPRDPRAIRLENYLRSERSVLADHTDLIIEQSDKYLINYKLVIAIAGVESGYCRLNFRLNNCWGFGQYSWANMEVAIKDYFRLLNRGYFAKGATTIEMIAPIYAPSSTDYLEKYYRHYNQIP
jgi:hypothetical protein